MPLTLIYQTAAIPTNEWLQARLKSVDGTDGSLRYNDSQCLRFVFELTDPCFGGRNVSVLTSSKLSEATKLERILAGLTGRKFIAGDQVEPESYVGQECEVMLEQHTGKGRTFYNVIAVRPVSG